MLIYLFLKIKKFKIQASLSISADVKYDLISAIYKQIKFVLQKKLPFGAEPTE